MRHVTLARTVDALLVLTLVVASVGLWRSRNAGAAVFALSDSATPGDRRASLQAQADAIRGRHIPDLEVYAPGDRSRRASLRGSGTTLVFIFRSDCRFCEQTAPVWYDLTTSLRASGIRVIAVNPESLPTASHWLGRHDTRPNELWVPTDLQAFAGDWGIEGVPATLIVDDDAKIQAAYFGVLTEDEVAAIQAAIANHD